jgi:LysR family transcriptional regulator, hydrogen peroxide-inducible genes activator
MNLRDLVYLVSIADYQHFSKAAKASHISQPTLSMQLKKLETYLGVQLIERDHKKVRLTSAGEAIVERARRILNDVQDIRELARSAQDPYSGMFRLGAFPTLAPYLLPIIVPLATLHLPRLQLFLLEEKSNVLVQQLKEGHLDAALLALPVKEDSLEMIPLFEDPFMLAIWEDHPLANYDLIDFNMIQDERLLLLEEGHCLRDQALAACQLAGAQEYPHFRATSLETLRQMVMARVGITLMPTLAAKKESGIIYIPFESPAPSRHLAIVYRKSSPFKLCVTALAELILNA